nr:LysE family translocator [uncultured Pseudomonas sp.]
MQEMTALFGIATALALGAASPGPSFVMVARTAIASSRNDGLFAALGMGVGALLFAGLALLGLQGLLLAIPSLYLALKVAGGLYLVYLGIRLWRGASQAHNLAELKPAARYAKRAFVLGLSTQISNPKTAIVYASVFAAFLPSAPTLTFSLGVTALVFAIESGWYALVAVALSAQRPRHAYLRYQTWIDRAAGGVMFALGLKLVLSARDHAPISL